MEFSWMYSQVSIQNKEKMDTIQKRHNADK